MAEVPSAWVHIMRLAQLGTAPAGEALAGIHAALVVGPQAVVRGIVATLLPCPSRTLTGTAMEGAAGLVAQRGAAGLEAHAETHSDSPPQSRGLATPASPLAIRAHVQVAARHPMDALDAVSSSATYCRRSHASRNVLGQGDGLKVRWVYARSIPTQVIDLKARRDFADVGLIREPVGHAFSTLESRSSVADVQTERPLPTSTRRDIDTRLDILVPRWVRRPAQCTPGRLTPPPTEASIMVGDSTVRELAHARHCAGLRVGIGTVVHVVPLPGNDQAPGR